MLAECDSEFYCISQLKNIPYFKFLGHKTYLIVYKRLEDCRLVDKVLCLSFDKTASNTGLVKGACTRLEMAFGRPVLWCACHHHIYELIAKAVWAAVFPEKSVCPGEKLCKDFSEWWEKAESIPLHFKAANRPTLFGDKNLFEDCLEDLQKLSITARNEGKTFHRIDYDEMLELCEVILYSLNFSITYFKDFSVCPTTESIYFNWKSSKSSILKIMQKKR